MKTEVLSGLREGELLHDKTYESQHYVTQSIVSYLLPVEFRVQVNHRVLVYQSDMIPS